MTKCRRLAQVFGPVISMCRVDQLIGEVLPRLASKNVPLERHVDGLDAHLELIAAIAADSHAKATLVSFPVKTHQLGGRP